MKNATTNRVVDIKAENIIADACAVGTYFYVDGFDHKDYALVRIELGYAYGDEEWECAEYYLINKHTGEAYDVAMDNGEGIIDWQMQEGEIAALIWDIDLGDYIESEPLQEDWITEAKRARIMEVDDDYEGECRIWVDYCYSAGTINAPKDDFLLDDDGDIMIFDSYDDAAEWIDDNTGGTYYLHHGEMGRPTYKIVEA